MADNSILIENQKPGTPKSVWDAPATNQIEGFATDISTNHGGTVNFKINLNVAAGQTAPYHIEIYRLGYYGGNGATLVTTLNNLQGVAQPNPVTDTRGDVDAGNWTVSASWATPATAVSGVYLAKLVRDDNGGTNQIPFIIRDDGSTSDIVLQTDDTTWQAYNGWAGNNGQVGGSLYGGYTQPAGLSADPAPLDYNRAFAVSYNRPIITRDGGGQYAGAQDYLFGATYSAVYWLEKNGYSVSYISGVDTDRLGAANLEQHKAYISVGHDEYWSGDQRANVEAARDAGVNLLFWSGNEVYWKTRWENSIADGQADRTLVTYKESKFNYSANAQPQDYANVDPSNQWTGTWRDTRFVNSVAADGVTHTAVGAKPENALSGQMVLGDGTGQFGGAINVPATMAALREWRNTGIGASGATNLAPGIIGYEWDTSPNDASRPAGLIKLSDTMLNWGDLISNYGNDEAPGTGEHTLTLYRAPSGALVFGAGTVFWSWGLSDQHDSSPYAANIASPALQQFTVDLFADMGIQPGVTDAFLQSESLVRASASNDHVAATAVLNTLPDSTNAFSPLTISGTANDVSGVAGNTDGVVALVEVSVDGGQTWAPAQGTTSWSFSWTPTKAGTYTIEARAIDDTLNLPSGAHVATKLITATTPPPPSTYSLFSAVTPSGSEYNDGQGVELGMKFSAAAAGTVTALRYWRDSSDASDTDTRQGHLWSSSGTLLGTVTFTSTPGQSGWQTATLSTPVAIQAGQTYVVSYHTADNYMAANNYFTSTVTDPWGELSAPSTANGIYAYGASAVFPNQTYQAANYWTDVVFAPTPTAPNGGPPTGLALDPSTDSGTVGDGITNTSAVVIKGVADANAAVTLYDGGSTVVGTGTADSTGAFKVTTAALADGVHSLTATETLSGTTSAASSALAVKIDTQAPLAPSGLADAAISSGVVSGASNTSSQSLTGSGEAGASIKVYDNGTLLGATTANSSGQWSYTLGVLASGAHSLTATATDVAANTGPASSPLAFTVASSISLFGSTAGAGTVYNDGQGVEVGMKFSVAAAGSIVSLRYYRASADANDTDTRDGHLWSSTGTLLGTVTFTSTPGQSGWQTATLSTPVAVQAGQTYVVSYHTADNYLAASNYFASAVSDPSNEITAPSSSASGGNGVYSYNAGAVFPSQTFGASNYWADVVFSPAGPSPQLDLSPTSLSLAEGNSGATAFAYTLTRSGDTSGVSSVNWAVAGSGVNPANASDFVGAVLPSGTVSFAAGETSKVITVNVAGDTTFEPDEGFTLTLSGATGATLGAAAATGTILNDDAAPVTQVGFTTTALSLPEGNSGATAFAYTVTRSGDTSGASSVNWAVTGSGASPADANDFVGAVLPSGTVSFAAGETSKVITVNVAGDTTFEPDEGFTVTLSGVAGASLGTATAAGTIVNDDPAPGQTLTGTSGADSLAGGAGADSLLGLAGADTLVGNGGADTLDGGGGADRVDGGAGDNLFLIRGTEAQSDTLIGGAGNDTLRVDPSGGAVTLASTANISGIEVFDGQGQTVQGNGSANRLDFSGFTTVSGVASINGLGGNDTLIGSSFNDLLNGGAGADSLVGGAGADTLIGGAGADTLTGGAGADVFRYLAFSESASSARDVITDFEGAGVAGGDVIDVSALTTVPFSFNGTGAFSGGGIPSIRYVIGSGVTDIQFDSGNGGTPEMVVRVTGAMNFSAGDFIL